MSALEHVALVPFGDSQEETARYITQTADKHGISQDSVKVGTSGFLVTEELADVLYDEDEAQATEPASESPETPDKAPAKTGKQDASGNRAAKNS